MKLRTLDRIFLFAGGFVTALVGVCVFLIGLRTEALAIADLGGEMVLVNRLMILISGAVLFVYGVYVMSLPQSYRKKKTDFVVQQTADGEMRISVQAMDGLVRKVMEMHSEMTLRSMEVENRKDSVYIDLKVAVAKNISIPLAVASVQKDIKQYLLSSTGVDVREVKVTVDTTDDMAKDSPYIMQETFSAQRPDAATQASGPVVFADAKPDEPLESSGEAIEFDPALNASAAAPGEDEDQWQEGDKQDNERN